MRPIIVAPVAPLGSLFFKSEEVQGPGPAPPPPCPNHPRNQNCNVGSSCKQWLQPIMKEGRMEQQQGTRKSDFRKKQDATEDCVPSNRVCISLKCFVLWHAVCADAMPAPSWHDTACITWQLTSFHGMPLPHRPQKHTDRLLPTPNLPEFVPQVVAIEHGLPP